MKSKYQSYPSYKDSGVEWLGKIPEHWNTSTLKFQLLNLDFRRIPISAAERGDIQGKHPYYGASGIIDYVEDYIFNETTILIGEDGANLLSKSTPLAFLAQGKYWVNNHAHILQPKDKLFHFWTYILNNLDLTPVISGSAQPKLTAEALGNLYVVFPPSIDERMLMANYLDSATAKIDTLIQKQERLIELLREKRQALISTAVTRGLDSSVKMKDSGVEWLGEIPMHWTKVAIKRISTVGRGASPRPIDDPKYFDDNGEYSWVRIADVSKSNGYLDKTLQQLSSLGSSLSVKMQPGELFVSIAGTVGKPCITNIKACIHDGFVYFPQIPSKYIKLLYRIFEAGECYGGLGKMGTQLNLNTKTVGGIHIAIAPDNELINVLDYIDERTSKIDTLITKATKAIELLKERRTALISAVVTGKIDVRKSA